MIPLNCWSESDQKAIREQLDRIVSSGPFLQSRRRQRFLEYLVNETLAGRGERLKGRNIALEVFSRPETFDPVADPLVRIEAARLREKLNQYYEGAGRSDPIRIDLPKGTYTPHIELRQAPTLGLQHWDSGPSLPDKPSVAVLPFDNIGDDPQWQRFADGITEDIIADLSHHKDLIAIARNSTEVYKGKPIDIRQIGRDLNVKYVLEGSIQSLGERIRVTAQLIEAASGSQVWSERYDRPADDLFAVQNDLTQRIAATLGGWAVAEAERRLLRRKPPANLSAFDTYLLAEGSTWAHKVTKESLIEAEGLFRKALQLDPHLARAYVGLVDVQSYLIDLGLAPSVEEALSKQMEAGEKAVQLDPNDGRTHYALGLAYACHGKPEQALAEFDRAKTLAPSDADLLLLIAWSLPQFGEPGRAVSLAERALTLNPHYPDWYNPGLRNVFFFAEQYDRSVKYGLLVKEPLALDYAFLAMAYAYLGRTGDAEAAAANVKKLDPTWIAERYLIEGGGYAEKEAELFVDGARKAGLPACVPADKLKDMPNLSRVNSCDQQRVGEMLAGRGDQIKGYNIAVEVLGRSEGFDGGVDPIVRVEAARLREKLHEYYDTEGRDDPVRIELPKGNYTPHIELRQAPTLGLQHWDSGPSLPDEPSVAVLPFVNIGDDPQWARFADGITEDIIADLSHSKDLIVIARNSTEVYKGKPTDIRQIGRDLNVKYVLEGSIQSMGDQIRVTAQLIEAASGGQVWSERYDRPVNDLFAVQNDVAQRITVTLVGYEGAVAEAERSLLRRKPPASLSAFDTYLLAEGSTWAHKVTKAGLIEAEGLLRKALQLDPQLARAYALLADVQSYLIDHGLAPSVEEALSKMLEAGEKAVPLDPHDGRTHYALGLAYTYHGKWEQALAEFARAETLAPSDAGLLLLIAWVVPQFGDSARAVSLAERALTLNPHYPDWYNQGLRNVFFFAEQYDRSVKYGLLVKEPLALDYAFLAVAYAYLGRTGDAEAAAANVKKLDPTWIAERYLIEGGGYAEKEAELFVDGARKAGLPACVPADKLKDMPNLWRVKSCDEQRAKISQ